MSFVVLLLAIVIEKFSSLRQRLQRDGGWLRELQSMETRPKFANRPWLVLAILILCPVALLALLLWVLDPVAYGLLALPVHVLVVIYSLGRGDIQAGLGPFRDAWRRGDFLLQLIAFVFQLAQFIATDSDVEGLWRTGHLCSAHCLPRK